MASKFFNSIKSAFVTEVEEETPQVEPVKGKAVQVPQQATVVLPTSSLFKLFTVLPAAKDLY